ncbi:MAG TPA: hypothetical protein VH476_07735 [Solirubrobacterales bacterium]
MSALQVLGSLAISAIWMGAWAQLIGIPIAWIRLRDQRAWANRPEGIRRLDLLAEFVIAPMAASVVWGWLVILVAAVGGLGLSGGALGVVMFGGPAIFVPWAVVNLNLARFPHVAERVRLRAHRNQG